MRRPRRAILASLGILVALTGESPSSCTNKKKAKETKKVPHLAPFWGGKREGKRKQKKVSTCIIPGMDTLEQQAFHGNPNFNLRPYFSDSNRKGFASGGLSVPKTEKLVERRGYQDAENDSL